MARPARAGFKAGVGAGFKAATPAMPAAPKFRGRMDNNVGQPVGYRPQPGLYSEGGSAKSKKRKK
jgi:hypothetical protein